MSYINHFISEATAALPEEYKASEHTKTVLFSCEPYSMVVINPMLEPLIYRESEKTWARMTPPEIHDLRNF